MADIFISYKREEQPIAKKLADALQKKGWTVWWDPEIRAGERFDDVIEKALIESKCVVVLWSKLSVESQNVKDEATYALNRDKLVPILIEEADLPFRFERINTGQLINWDGSDKFPGYQKLITDVISILGEPPVEEEKRKREQAEREAEKERRHTQEAERKLWEDKQRKAKEEPHRLEEDKQRLAEQKRKFEEEQKRIEAARKTEEERKQKEDEATRKAEEEKRHKEKEELKCKSEEEERKQKEAEENRKSEEERKRKEVKSEIKPDKSEPVKTKPSQPKSDAKAPTEPRPSPRIPPKSRKASNALKFGSAGFIVVLLIVGIWWYVSRKQVNEVRQEIDEIKTQALKLEDSASKINKPDDYGFLVPIKLGVRNALELDGAVVCVVPGTNSELKAAKFFRDNRLNMKSVVIESQIELSRAFLAGRCDCLFLEIPDLTQTKNSAFNPSDYTILKIP